MIDFSEDVKYVRQQLAAAVAEYATRHDDPRSAKDHPPVTRLDLDLWLGDGGDTPPAATVQIDTIRRDGWDAEWTHPQFAVIEFPHWKKDFDGDIDPDALDSRAFRAALDAHTIDVRPIDGGAVRTITSKKFDQTIHGFFVDALLAVRDAGVFERLPKAPLCELNVVNNDCGFAWPTYDDFGLHNMADPRENGTRRSSEPPRSAEERLAHDATVYDVWLGPWESSAKAAAITVVNAALNIGLPAARTLVERGDPIARDVNAVEVRRLARLFAQRGLALRIDPLFPHPLE